MVSELVEGFNKIRKPLLTGYCAMFSWWLRHPNATAADLGFNAEQTSKIVDLWTSMPGSTKTALIGFTALMIGGAIDAILRWVWMLYGSKAPQAWIRHDALDDDTSFGLHAASRFFLLSLSLGGSAPKASNAISAATIALVITAASRKAHHYLTYRIRHQGQVKVKRDIKQRITDLAQTPNDPLKIMQFEARGFAENHPEPLEDAVTELLDEHRLAETSGATEKQKEEGLRILHFIRTRFRE